MPLFVDDMIVYIVKAKGFIITEKANLVNVNTAIISLLRNKS